MGYTKYEVRSWSDGSKVWYLDGKRHRTDGPAVEHATGYKAWRLYDKLHRIGGPAVEYTSGDKYWYFDGKLHRTDGPSAECANGDKLWHQDGKRHRTDGPAVECADGSRYWYLEGKELTEAEFNARTKPSILDKMRPYPTVQALLNINDDLVARYGQGLCTVEVSRAAYVGIVKELCSDDRRVLDEELKKLLGTNKVFLTSVGGTFGVLCKEGPQQDSNPWVATPYVWKR